ncbi:MAG: trehalose-6-phosphate synthase [Acidimicrobiales bacterium]
MSDGLVIASNRGPLSYGYDDGGTLVARQGAGGLVSSLGPLVEGSGATWVAAAMSDADRAAAAAGLAHAEGFRHRLVDIDPAVYRPAYDVIANATLWFLNHRLFDLSRSPRIDTAWRHAWDCYRQVNARFAEAIMEDAPRGATVMIQDYHLALVGSSLVKERPDLRTVHFTHTPFMDPIDLRVLPDEMATELMEGMASFRACGFHTRNWADAFGRCALAASGKATRTFVAPLAPDAANLAAVAASAACVQAGSDLEDLVGDRRVILRVDRIELSKNLLRGFLAFDELLSEAPRWRERVVFVAFVYPSREALDSYIAYRGEVVALVERINDRWATAGWTPIVLDMRDDYPRSVAALQRYDVLLVNPVRDGLNLVAKEGPLVNERNGVLVLSREAGAWEELGGCALGINPFDVSGTAGALAEALSMDAAARTTHARELRRIAALRSPKDWLDDQLAASTAE